MQTRKNFLLQGSIFATGLLAAKPLAAFSKITAPFNAILQNENSLLLVHYTTSKVKNVTTNIAKLKSKISNTLLLNHQPLENIATQKKVQNEIATCNLNTYKIIQKGRVKVGLLSINKNSNIETINSEAALLKNEQNCTLVVCVSSLGFKNNTGIDDIQFAAKSSNVDIIISDNETNYCAQPYVALNNKKNEVLINHSKNKNLDLGSIALTFDQNGNKNSVDFLLN